MRFKHSLCACAHRSVCVCVCVCLCACGCRCNVILKIVVRLLQSPADSAPKNIPRKKRTYFQETNKTNKNKTKKDGEGEGRSLQFVPVRLVCQKLTTLT